MTKINAIQTNTDLNAALDSEQTALNVTSLLYQGAGGAFGAVAAGEKRIVVPCFLAYPGDPTQTLGDTGKFAGAVSIDLPESDATSALDNASGNVSNAALKALIQGQA